MKNTALISAAALLIAGLFAFQNCSGGFNSNSWNAADSSGSGSSEANGVGGSSSTTIPVNAAFNKGDAFNIASIASPSQLVQTELTMLNYSGYTAGTKAVALNAMGLGYVSIKSAGTQIEANTTALEGCYALGGGLPCALVAEGDVFAVSSANLANAYTFSLSIPTEISAATIPFLRSGERGTAAQAYNGASGQKALAISVDGSYFWATANGSTGAPSSLADAKRVAMERCELEAAITPCTLFAENSTVVFNPALINRTPVIDYARASVMTNIPGMTDSNFQTLISNDYLTKLNATTHGVIYITRAGGGGMAYNGSATQAETNALGFCNSNTTSAHPCVRYAVDKDIKSVSAMLLSLQRSLVNHCAATPRANCAAHKAMGCAGGMMYTMDGATPKLENCL